MNAKKSSNRASRSKSTAISVLRPKTEENKNSTKPKRKVPAKAAKSKKNTRPARVQVPFFNYDPDLMRKAIEAVKAGMSGRKASEMFRVPHATLARKIRLGLTEVQKMGPSPVLKSDEEEMLVKWMLHVTDAGFPIEKDQILDNVQAFILKLKRPNPFKEGRPGDKWFHLFSRRHPDISTRLAQNLTKARAAVTEESLKDWFNNVNRYFLKNNLEEALKDPKRIFSLDESAFFFSPESGSVLAKRNSEVVYNFTANNDKECTTVFLGGNAAGMETPPMMVVKLKKLNESHFEDVPPHWLLGKLLTFIIF